MKDLYVHIGHKEFDENLFRPIKNRDGFVKPYGGLWATPITSPYTWEDWVRDNNFNNTIGFEKYGKDRFTFRLKPKSKILLIDDAIQLKYLPQIKDDLLLGDVFTILDFEKLAEEYDAILVLISRDYNLYDKLYGWDVDSILVMNPNCIEIVESES